MFRICRTNEGVDVIFTSSVDNVDLAAEETKSYLSDNGLEADQFDILLLLREGLMNAVKHGSRFDASKIVTFTFRVENDCAIMTVEDEGNGFDWKATLSSDPSQTKDHGRGLPIMKQYCTHIEFNDKGNVLTLKKKLSKIGGCHE